MEEDHKELQLLPSSHPAPSSSHNLSSWPPDSSLKFRSMDPFDQGPSLDLQLSASVRPMRPPPDCVIVRPICTADTGCVEALKWQASEQFRLASIEKDYAERVNELTRREMEMAQSDFARARHIWERAREEVNRAEKMKERATRRIDSASCMEITCQSCRKKFRS